MQKDVQIRVFPQEASAMSGLKRSVAKKIGVAEDELWHIEVLKRSIDARKRPVKIQLHIRAFIQEDPRFEEYQLPQCGNVSAKEEVLIVGAGPAGLFAAIKCIMLGYKPIILERGKDVRSRRRDLKAINLDHFVDNDSNYCFGEGGAGTYSDGKLYTRSKKKGDIKEVLRLLIAFGAKRDILIDAHPHIGTNKLPAIISNIRAFIEDCGGEVHFGARINKLNIQFDQISGVELIDGRRISCKSLILATGHSARDVFEMLYEQGIEIESKPFALGVRVEHPQKLIDSIQYHCETRGEFLPPAPYSIVRQIGDRGVYSFCMCPGGIIAPCATGQEEVVTNGWSPSKRDQKTANSGIVVELNHSDFAAYSKFGPLAGMEFQRNIEHRAWVEGGKTQAVPAQRLVDFVHDKYSNSIPYSSYKPGTRSVRLTSVLPEFIYNSLKQGFKLFGKSMKGYLTNEAVVHAPESRTSSPIRIPRDEHTLQHIRIKGLYPCGEGAGYAGGIVSAAIDGMRCASAISRNNKIHTTP